MRSQYKLRFDCKQTNPRQSNRVNTGVFCFKSILWEFRWLMFLFLLAISDWLNFQPCNRKKERRVKIFLGEVAVVVVPQSIRRLSLQKSQPLAIETRFYLFQNCHIFFFHEKNKREAVARYSDGGVDDTAICSFLFSWLGLYFLC